MKFIYYFVVCSVSGWILETVFRSIKNKKLINPGFNKGFYLPIYGWGGLIILAGHSILETSGIPAKFIFYFIFLSLLELGTGLIVEKFYHIRLWDYRNEIFNFRGYVCLIFSTVWAVLAVVVDYLLIIIPPSYQFYERIFPALDILLFSILVIMILDSVISTKKRFKKSSEKELRSRFSEIAEHLLGHPDFIKLKYINHHPDKTRFDHVVEVAWISFCIADRLSLDCKATVCGALLHDLFYYDWRIESPGFHAFKHHITALRNAEKITHLSKKEKDIIKKHMWPLTIIPPLYPESLLVSMVDTYCSLKDFLIISNFKSYVFFYKKISKHQRMKTDD